MEGFEVNAVSKIYYDEKQRPFPVLHEISFHWPNTENIAIIGESGSGKSTLARLLVGLETPTTGKILMDNKDMASWSRSVWRKKRRIIQAVFQDASGTLNPARSVYHNVEEALCNLTELTRCQRKERIAELMELTHMRPELLQVPTRQLSGGEQRRLALLRALAIHPKYLILDEVTSGLDSISTDAVLKVLEKYHAEYGCAYLMITHDKQTAYRIADHIFEMQKGAFVREAIRTETNKSSKKGQ